MTRIREEEEELLIYLYSCTVHMYMFVCLFFWLDFFYISARRPAMLGLMGFSGSLPLYVIHRYYISMFIDRANKDACLLA